mmetsp:Transcript_12570/g.25243  ORF Transcript_12570/g.25243 Transcript_12570/m.25243 type:complete len:210 (-) Transcript_12570:405-1034(-)
MNRRITPDSSSQSFELTQHATSSLAVLCNDIQSSNTLSVQSKILTIRLSHEKLHATRLKVPWGVRILIQTSRCKSLIGHIKEGHMSLLLDGIRNRGPLFFCRIDSSRIVSATMQQNHGSLWSCLDICNHTSKIQANSLLIKVSIGIPWHARQCENILMIWPRWVGNIHRLARQELMNELSSNGKRPCPRQSLQRCHTILFQRSRVISQQ